MAIRNGKKPANGENIAAAVTEVSERVSMLVREEFELAKAEVSQKLSSIARGTAAGAAGSVFGFFAVTFFLLTLAWVFDAILVSGAGDIWIGFAIVFGILTVLTVAAFMFAWRKLRVGAPKPDMAIDEAKKIRETVTASVEEPQTVAVVPTNGQAVAVTTEGSAPVAAAPEGSQTVAVTTEGTPPVAATPEGGQPTTTGQASESTTSTDESKPDEATPGDTS